MNDIIYLIGAAVAWFATAAGARHARDESLMPIWRNRLWSPRRVSTFPLAPWLLSPVPLPSDR
jgi:hypothetical protein